ncbi:MAG: tol-pal system protein YbgF [Deltaproteobacteria bacterium]|nr:tol-pal system protein YbgF [Deltaproteobacteria bacterium]
MVKFKQFFLMSKYGSFLLLFAALTACSSNEAEYRAAVEQLQIDQEIQDIRFRLAEEKLTDHEMRLDGQQRTLEALLDRLPAPLRAQASSSASPAAKAVAQTPAVKTGQATAQSTEQAAQPKSSAASTGQTASQSTAQTARPKSAERTAYDRALATFDSGQAQGAEALFTDFMRLYPQSDLAPNAEYWLGECFYTQKRYGEAILAFQNVAAQYPEHNKAAAALLKTGYSYEHLSDPQNARFYLQQLLEYYPKSEPAPLARKALERLR